MLWFIYLQRTAVVNVFWLCRITCFSGDTHLLLDYLHLLFDGHAPDAEGSAQLRRALVLQELAVVLDDAVRLPRQLPLQEKEETATLPHNYVTTHTVVCIKTGARVYLQKGRWWGRRVPLSCRRAGAFPAPGRTWWWAEWTPESSLSPWTQCRSYLCQKAYKETGTHH